MKKTISVIVTTYNSEKTIDRTLNSIMNQVGNGTEFDIELLVIDDCSTDRTIELANQHTPNVLSTGHNSGGPNHGRNLGLQKCMGDYICIADHDDEWKPHKLISQLPFLEQVSIVSSGYSWIDHTRAKTIEKIKPFAPGTIYYDTNETFLNKLTKSLHGQNVYLGSLIYRNELKHIRFEENFGMVDFDWILRLFHGRDSIEVNQSLYNRYVDGSNLSLNEGYRKRDFYFSLMHIEEFANDYPREAKIAYKRLYGSRARYYYLTGNMALSRFYFLRSSWDFKTLGYFLTTFFGAEYVKRKFNVFG